MIRIVVDAMGGDDAPRCNVEGALKALEMFSDVSIGLVGQVAAMQPFLPDPLPDRLTLVDTPDVIDMHESPVMAVRRKPNASVVRATMLVREGEADAMCSAGSTGALLACGLFKMGRIPGIDRPALAPMLPGRKKPSLLIDCGANADCLPEYLSQFALMGSVYMQKVAGVASPEVGLINIGVEEGKGSELYKSAYSLMKQRQPYTFVGNIEARDVPEGVADVLVADGFVGNVVLKLIEGSAKTLMGMIKAALMQGPRGKLAGLLAKPAFRSIKKATDASEVGGAPLLGVDGVMVKAHGNSDARAIANAVGQARQMVEGQVVSRITEGVAQLSTPSEETQA